VIGVGDSRPDGSAYGPGRPSPRPPSGSARGARPRAPTPTPEPDGLEASWRVAGGGAADPFGGRFRVLGTLGRGGMGAVYRAVDEASGRTVALKVLTCELDPRQRERFRREGEVTARLRHPGIVGIHDAGTMGGRPFIAYELVEGGRTFEGLLEDRGASLRVRLEALRDAAQAVGFAHRAGVVHRDLKPANLLIDAEGRVKVADFGLARAEGADRMTQTGAMMGTPVYMAPEQVQADRDVGPGADVWALGVLLYQVLTGELPFEGDSFYELAARIIDADPALPRGRVPAVAPELEAVCLKALEGEPTRRYADAGGLAADLEGALTTGEVSAVVSGLRVRRWLRRRGRALLAAGALLLAVAGAAALVVALRPAPVERAATPDEVLREALTAFRRDAGDPTLLAEALAATPEAGAPLRAEAQLALATEPALDAGGWVTRLEAAEAAGALGADPAAVAAARGEALLALGRPGEAAAAFADAGDRPALVLRRGEALIAAGRALEALGFGRELARARPEAAEGWLLQVRALLALGEAEEAAEALERLTRERPGPWVELLKVEVDAAAGRDPLPELRRLIGKRATPPDVLRDATALLLERGELREAAAVLAARRELPAPVDRVAAAVERLAAGEEAVEALRRAPPRERASALRWLLAEAERDVALAEPELPLEIRTGGHPMPEPLDPAVRLARARGLLEQVVAVAPGTALAVGAWRLRARAAPPESPARAEACARVLAGRPDDGAALVLRAAHRLASGEPSAALEDVEAAAADPRWRSDPDALHLRGRALLATDRPDEAADVLRAAWGPERLDVDVAVDLVAALESAGRSEGAAEVAARLALLQGARREEAHERYVAIGNVGDGHPTQQEEIAEAEAILAIDPLCFGARLERSESRSRLGEFGRAFREIGIALEAAPYLYAEHGMEALRELGKIRRQSGSIGMSKIEDVLADVDRGDDPADDFTRLFLCAALVEHEGRGEPWISRGLRRADALIADRPGFVVAYVVRAQLHVRAGNLVAAERDVAILREAAPGLHAFPAALLAAVGSASPERLLDMLTEARRRYLWPSFEPEAIEHYPELQPYLEDPEFVKGVESLH